MDTPKRNRPVAVDLLITLCIFVAIGVVLTLALGGNPYSD